MCACPVLSDSCGSMVSVLPVPLSMGLQQNTRMILFLLFRGSGRYHCHANLLAEILSLYHLGSPVFVASQLPPVSEIISMLFKRVIFWFKTLREDMDKSTLKREPDLE